VHDHGHEHHNKHVHPHDADGVGDTRGSRRHLIAWSLFVVFVLGPCEPLVPLMLVPASQRDPGTLLAVALVFVLVTVVTMMSVVYALTLGLDRVTRMTHSRLNRFGHVAAGSTLACCGMAMLLGL
jgi:nickel/cobalt transporter (NicO) family protein